MTIYAKWEEITYTVVFKSNGGSSISNQIVKYGNKVIKPKDPTKNKYTFKGWYKDIDLTEEFDFTNEIPTSNITLYAKWKLEYNNQFTDVKQSDWYYNAIKYVYENKIISGTTETTFAPNNKLTRAMMATILYNMENSPKITNESPFIDVNDSSKWYYDAVVWAAKNKIVSGYSDGRFGPNDYITREQLAIMLYNFAKYKGKDLTKTNDLSAFSDSNKVASYAITQVKWAVGSGVITGTNGKLNPKGNATRAEAASMIYKYCENIGR